MKQITIVLHFDEDKEAEELFRNLRHIRHDPDKHLKIFGNEIRHLAIKGPND